MTSPASLSIEFVCLGNICRSPMAEVIVRAALADAGLGDDVAVTSSGIGSWHVGQPADRRAVAELAAAGYDGSACRAETLSERTFAADLIVALDTGHRSELIARGADPAKVRLLRDFDPSAGEDASVADPYYGGAEGFALTRTHIEAAAPGLVDWARAALD
ncbi:low molecular weight protein-tyrosine-phosphatase [Corynebacterium uterequi]|uniref:protein-tyrosine-phosphatase n=1 Tax=Corynebacterium uterequi TaxID=1072256 RepID=A0A0G3HK68_9CORY|nr:low molecular weight protein-tyrosine-phosphatase [Corynebacterium uterequi]AKK11547.1 protein-tyrosine-phosphatase [Corynebacterium uterequi]